MTERSQHGGNVPAPEILLSLAPGPAAQSEQTEMGDVMRTSAVFPLESGGSQVIISLPDGFVFHDGRVYEAAPLAMQSVSLIRDIVRRLIDKS